MIKLKHLYASKVIPMALLVLFFILFSLSFKNKNNLYKVLINSNLPVVQGNGNVFNAENSFSIIYNGDYTFYEFPITATVEIDHKLVKSYTKFSYFGIKNGTEYGFFYDSLKTKKYHKMLTDSILTARTFKNIKLFERNKEILCFSTASLDKYIFKSKFDASYPDTTFIYYSDKLKHIEYSFSKELDSLKGMKAQKIVLLYNAQQYAGMPVKFPERRLSFEMNEVPITNLEEIKSLFERLKEDYKTLKK